MDPQVWGRVVTRSYSSEKGTVSSFARLRIRGEVYPALVKKEGASTRGVLYYDITGEDLARLDSFEGDAYDRISITVVTEAGVAVRCDTYLFSESLSEKVIDEPWDFDSFVDKSKKGFMEGYPGF